MLMNSGIPLTDRLLFNVVYSGGMIPGEMQEGNAWVLMSAIDSTPKVLEWDQSAVRDFSTGALSNVRMGSSNFRVFNQF